MRRTVPLFGVSPCRRTVTVLLLLSPLLLVFGATVPAPAESFSFTLSEALEAGRRQAPELKRAAVEVAGAERVADSGWNLFLPELQIGGSLSRSFFPASDSSPWSSGLSASASITLPGAARERLRARDREYEAALMERSRAKSGLDRNVQERFYAVLLSEQWLEIAERNAERAERQLERVRERYEAGRSSERELLEARSAALGRRPEVLSRRRAVVAERAAFKELLGLAPDDELRLRGEIDVPDTTIDVTDAKALESFLLARSLRLRAARAEAAGRDAQIIVTSRESKPPRLSAGVSYDPRFSPAFAEESWGDSAAWRTGSLSLRLTIPVEALIPHSEADNRVRAAEDDAWKAWLTVSQRERELRRLAAQRSEELEISLELQAVLEESVELERERYERTVTAYGAGGAELGDVEAARAELERAEIDLLEERHGLVMMLVELHEEADGALIKEE
ncbi:MAG: TolC family protein [Spirochaetaceae bacterium]